MKKMPVRGPRFAKGQHPIFSHTLSIAFMVMLVIAVATTLNSIKSDLQDFVGKHEIKNVCSIIRNSIENIYLPEEYQSPTNTVYGKARANLPDRIALMSYRARFINSSLYIETLGGLQINDTCKIGFPAAFSGSVTGGLTEFRWTRYSNGTDAIEMVKK